MKLYLSSFHLGDRAKEFADMVSGDRRVGVIRNSLDTSTDYERLRRGQEQEFEDLQAIGLNPESIDLREFFENQNDLRGVVDSFDALWVVGGNTFVLRRAMQQSGFDAILLDKVEDERFVYGGYSAGICVLTPNLDGIHLVDDPDVVPEGYSDETIWEGLGIVPFSIAPHYRSDHPESEMIEKSVEYFIENKIPFIALRDGDVYTGDTH
ncbi:MAG: Type 1 glutamine amidotransferase-like domain-containing protein [SAR202 cluster bacterium]|jgi:dipeptidase E|nr:Type 1 glutamine amidotransferase-like domain-containing protein [SAR202 cluster bacterium]MDP6511587.1 Type 1 glutamine amidotransferase-like domain-containing protein [SAR202 cluster bacterium]MDP6715293.1 Type 1 glutamine amidotransferase-like domain-containing protein [SAR202 cluster bacterium]